MDGIKTIILVLKSGGDFELRDVLLIARHINGKWQGANKPRIICFYDKATREYDLGNVILLPLKSELKGTWSRMYLYSPDVEKYKPFLYVDLDTIIVNSLENIFNVITNESQFITLEDFWQKKKLATGLVWFPKDCIKTKTVWEKFKNITGNRMDNFLRTVISSDNYWQSLTNTIFDFKNQRRELLQEIPVNADIICFHGKPRIFECQLPWVVKYRNYKPPVSDPLVTVIIPYNKDRGWLKDAVNSVPDNVELILSKGDYCWPKNFNDGLKKAHGKYIKYLHEDDMLTPNCIFDSVEAIEEQDADFIHGNAIELYELNGRTKIWKPIKSNITLHELLEHNYLHSATLMYRREVFEKIGGFDESLGITGGAEEYEFNLRCLKEGLKIGYCDSELAIYRRHEKQRVRTIPKELLKEERNRVKNMYQ